MPENSYLNLLNGLNYKVNQVLPTLTSIKLKDDFLLQHMAKLRVEAEASLYVNEELICRHRGEVQFNRDNISGFPIFQLSHMAVRSINEKKYVKINVDIYPDEAVEELTGRFQREIKALPGISIINFLRPKLPEGLATYVISTAGLSKESMIHSISDSELFNMSHILKNISSEASGYSGFEAAQAAQGGVDVSRIYAASMESKLHSGLYFCGEVIDVDGLCGGYNLQWAWSTGYIAGINAAKASKI